MRIKRLSTWTSLLFISTIILLSSCKGNDDKENYSDLYKKLEGKWVLKSHAIQVVADKADLVAEAEMYLNKQYEGIDEYTYEFHSNGSYMIYRTGMEPIKGAYKGIEEDKVAMLDFGSTDPMIGALSGNTLEISIDRKSSVAKALGVNDSRITSATAKESLSR